MHKLTWRHELPDGLRDCDSGLRLVLLHQHAYHPRHRAHRPVQHVAVLGLPNDKEERTKVTIRLGDLDVMFGECFVN